MHAYTVEPLYVKSGQDVIAADFYRPKTEHKPGVIIMAHGLACLRQFKLIQFAKRYAQAGYAVVLFDYRYWGGSTGRPRELVSLQAQLDDWHTMLMHVAQRKSIDNRKIVLWGISLSAGYVLEMASENKNIQAAELQRYASEQITERTKQEIENIIYSSYSEVSSAQQSHQLLQQNLKAAQENLRIQSLSFKEDMGTATQVIDAQNMLSSLKAEMALNAYKYVLSLATLLQSHGSIDQFQSYVNQSQTNYIR